MAFSVNTNSNAMAALRSLSSTQNNITSIQSQIQSGLKIGGATDDPSTFVISQGMRGDVGSLKAVQEGLNFGKATVGMALAAATQISDQLTGLQAKVTQASNEGLDTATLQSEADEMVAQIAGIVTTAEFNGINLLDNGGTTSGLNVLSSLGGASLSIAEQNATTAGLGIAGLDLTATHGEIALGNGFNPAESNTFTITIDGSGDTHTFELDGDANALTTVTDEANGDYVYGVSVDFANDSNQEIMGKVAAAMREEGFAVDIGEDGVVSISASGQDITLATTVAAGTTLTQDVAGTALTDIAAAKTAIGSIMTNLGTYSNRLDSQAEFTQVLSDKLEEGLGILVDANLAEVSAKLQSEQTKEQLGIQSLSIANAASQSILGLFR
ncbi:MAG: flagellin [Sneathiella sp.]